MNAASNQNKLLPLLFAGFILTGLSSFASAQTTKWKIFTHHNGFTIQLPAYFKKGLLVAGGTLQYYEATSYGSVSVSVETFGIGTVTELQSSYETDVKNYSNISYKVLKSTWYVISGQDDQGIFYNKSIIKNGVQHHLRISYPPNQKAVFDGLLSKITASFK